MNNAFQYFSHLPHTLASLIADGSAGSVIIITIVCSLIMHRLAAADLLCCCSSGSVSAPPIQHPAWGWDPVYPVFPVTTTSRTLAIGGAAFCGCLFCCCCCCCVFFLYYPTCSCLRVSAVVLECECCTSWKVDGNFACFNLFVLLILKYAINFP